MKNHIFGKKGMFLGFAAVILVLSLASTEVKAVIQPQVGPPTITVTSLAGDSCGVECFGVKVTWTATVPAGTKITGYKVEVTPPTPCPGCVSPVGTKDAAGSATSATVQITTAGTLPSGNYTAKVTASYTSTVANSKSQAL